MKKTLEAIDIAKFIASILVFIMHCGILNDYKFISVIPQIIARWGVPYFFICSSYFLFSKRENTNIGKDAIYKYVHRIVMLYIMWFAYNIPNIIYQRLWSNDLYAIRTWLVFIKDSILSSTFTGSWYLVSSIFSAWFIYVLNKKLSTKTIIGITFVFYFLCVFMSVYYGIMPTNILKILNFLCFPLNIFNGCFYFSLGKYIAENRQVLLKKYNKNRAFIGFVVFYLLFIVEICLARYFKIRGSTDVAFSTIGMSGSLFLFCLQVHVGISYSLLLRKLSIIIYCAQGNILLVGTLCRKILGISYVISFFVSVVFIAIICICVLYIQNTKQWKWTKYLT